MEKKVSFITNNTSFFEEKGNKMGLFGPNIQKMQKENDTQGLKQVVLKNQNQKTRVKAIKALAEMGKTSTLISLMADPVLMQVIIPFLVKMDDKATKQLVKALDHSNYYIQGGAATVLSITRRTTYETEQRIAEKVADKNCKARIPMIMLLGKVSGKGGTAEKVLREATRDKDPEISNAAMLALGEVLTRG